MEIAGKVGTLLQNKPRDIWSLEPSSSVYEAVRIMAEKEVGALLVMREQKLVGIVSERDYARKIVLQGRSSHDTPVADIMTSPVITVTPAHTIGECMRIVTERRIRHLPVVDGEKVTGIVSIGDLVNWVVSEQQATIRHLEAWIAGTMAS
ncbi:MAG TPA: CBS domain-containing protein [Acidobacteriaceae bacterium]|jgi:CBS domain-containing protein|nr:CBS domain-containing protein [Acidobacteriaceae bacterium]